MGTPPGQLPGPHPDSPWWLLGPFPVEQEPQGQHQGCTSGAQLLSSPTSLGPGTWGRGRPGAASTLLNPGGRDGQGAACRGSRWCHAHGGWPRPPGTGAAVPGWGLGGCLGGGVWRGHFPAQTDGAGLELWLPQGGGRIWSGVSAQQCRDSADDVLGWDGREPVGHGGGVTGDAPLPSPESPPAFCVLQRRRLQVPRGPAAPGLRQGEPGTLLRGDIPTKGPSPGRAQRLAQPRRPGTGAQAEARALCAAGPGSGNPLPTKGTCWCAQGGSGPGQPARGSQPGCAGGLCAPAAGC